MDLTSAGPSFSSARVSLPVIESMDVDAFADRAEGSRHGEISEADVSLTNKEKARELLFVTRRRPNRSGRR
jgi:hypothetical protein